MVVNIRFLATSPIFVRFIFVFASSVPFNTTVDHTHFVKLHSLDSFLNKKMKIKPHENYLLYSNCFSCMHYSVGLNGIAARESQFSSITY